LNALRVTLQLVAAVRMRVSVLIAVCIVRATFEGALHGANRLSELELLKVRHNEQI
jgi:hypothetical protein